MEMGVTLIKGVLLSIALVSSVQASTAVLTGSINAGPGGGLTATGPWGNQSPLAMLSWNISESEGLWTYHYIFNLPAKNSSHAIFEVGENFTTANIYSGTTAGWELGTWGTQGNSNPGIPSPVYGLKFPGSGLSDVYTLVTNVVPEWGDFYAKDGKHGGNNVYAFSSSFGSSSSDSIYGPAPLGFVLVPGTMVSSVPEPHMSALFAVGMLGVVGAYSRRKKTQT